MLGKVLDTPIRSSRRWALRVRERIPPWALQQQQVDRKIPGARPLMKSTKSRQISLHRWNGVMEGTYQVVSEQLHDKGRILIALLTQCVELSNGIIESLLRQVASLIGGVQDLVIEDREVQGQTKTDWVCWGEISLSNFGSILVSFKRLVGRSLSLLGNSELGEISMIVTLPTIAN
jgi:hypothetical protein